MTKRRVVPVLGACALMAAGIGASAFTNAPAANAAACPNPATPVGVGVGCTITGTLTMTSGSMALTSPTALTWTDTVNGADQQVADVVTGHQTYQVNDARGTDAGWNVTVAATTFIGSHPLTDTHTFADTGTFWTNGSVTEATPGTLDGTTPTAACFGGSTCTLPDDTALVGAYPVNIVTAAAATPPTAFSVYQAAAGTGEGTITIGGSTSPNPVGWWLEIPSNITQDVYRSTITLTVDAAP